MVFLVMQFDCVQLAFQFKIST